VKELNLGDYKMNDDNLCECSDHYDCCDCGGYECGCAYCFSCNACEYCLEDDDDEDNDEEK
jgi:hypothetical protein